MIYLDNAATTALRTEVFERMVPFLKEEYANPSGIHSFSFRARRAIDDAREQIAESIGATPNEIFFTSGGTEADNWAIRGTFEKGRDAGNHLITDEIEHHAVLNTCKNLEKHKVKVTYLKPEKNGLIMADEVKSAIRPATRLISIMAANNEIGTIMPIAEIGALARERGILFHTDAVQAFGHIPIHVQEMSIDLLSASAHKFYGPKGCGFLYQREGVHVEPLMYGGEQENGLRPGTYHVAGIVGMGAAAELAVKELKQSIEREQKLRNRMIAEIQSFFPQAVLCGHPTKRLPNNVHFCFPGLNGEALIHLLDGKEVYVSGGAACTTTTLVTSHVLHGIGIGADLAKGALRITLSRDTTETDVKEAIRIICEQISRLQRISS